MRAAALYGTVGSLILSALAAAPAGGAATAPPDGVAQARGVAVAARQAAARGISFGRCAPVEKLPAAVQCGTVSVPLDYARPDGRRIDLTVSRARATGRPAERQGSLIFNPGGPGGSGMVYPTLKDSPAWRKAARAYDLVGYAPRGVGRSAPISCQDPAEFAKAPTQSPRHPSDAFKRHKAAQARAYAQGCARRAGAALPHFTSLNNARDLDVLRAALGDAKLNFVGASYGTYFGALYATLFPGHVRRVVFDSVVDPDPRQIWYRSNLDQAPAFEARWADWSRWAARHDRHYRLGRTPERVRAAYDRVHERLAREPAGGTVGPAQLQAAFLNVGYNDAFWASRAHALAAYLRGDPKPLIAAAAPDPATARADENENAVYTAVECNDASWPRDWRVWDRDNTRLARRAPFETWDNAWMNLPCAYWPAHQQRAVDVGVKGGAELPPTLLLAAERDAATPYPGALELQRRLPGSALVTERAAGTHGIGGGPNQCVNRHLETYLLTGKTPARRAYCAPRPEPKPVP
ncbi:alpha/beta hydrolase [Streptomyces sp. NPDC050610]|uniref:alpha/beta hydrolase n=1 Tax=Streptomyces sp. NPDC050610 TaxID=3157097 RepID=UPI00342564B3